MSCRGLSFVLLLCAWTSMAHEPAGGGAAPVPGEAACLSQEQRLRIQARLRESIAELAARGVIRPLPSDGRLLEHPQFAWPLAPVAGFPDPGYHGISNFVDHDLRYPDQLLDYSCGARTYDLLSGYNHSGTDIFLWPFSWLMMDQEQVQIVAAAPGTILLRDDGNFDRNCSFSNPDWNAVYVRHTDGSVAWYGHMKKDSLTSKTAGASVEAGEYLGLVGSSGSSTGPHLHFEVYDAQGYLIDPFAGACNGLNVDSWWESQRPYQDSALNKIATHSQPPEFPACSTDEVPHYSDQFVPGSLIYFAAYYRAQLAGQPSDYSILRPDGSTYYAWTHASPDTYSASYWYWYQTIPAREPQGTWTFRVSFQGVALEHPFNIGTAPTPTATPSVTPASEQGTPTPTATPRPAVLQSSGAWPLGCLALLLALLGAPRSVSSSRERFGWMRS